MAWSQVGEWKKIMEKLMRAKVRTMPRKGTAKRCSPASRAELEMSFQRRASAEARAQDKHGRTEKDRLQTPKTRKFSVKAVPQAR